MLVSWTLLGIYHEYFVFFTVTTIAWLRPLRSSAHKDKCVDIRCIRVLATKTSEKISVASTRTHGRSEEKQSSSG